MGKPMMIDERDCDVEELTLDDFVDGETTETAQFAILMMQFAKLSMRLPETTSPCLRYSCSRLVSHASSPLQVFTEVIVKRSHQGPGPPGVAGMARKARSDHAVRLLLEPHPIQHIALSRLPLDAAFTA